MDSNNSSPNPLRFSLRPALVFVGFILATLLSGNLLFDDLRDGVKLEAQRNIEAVGALKAWLLGHISYSDKKMAAYLVQHGVK